MKKISLLLITFFAIQIVSAQEQTSQLKDTIYDYKNVDVKPDFSEGVGGLYKFINKNFQKPKKEGLYGNVISTFVIETDGSITDIKVLKDVGYGSSDEIIRVLKKSGKWVPATLNGLAVRCHYQLPIRIDTRR
ncbi:MAG TPA: energy transducer TonB [Flavobacterium sp.]|nr:energy transducer TonB [Flavobacterium sp.]HRA72983.1 energy transducer TonB [Flavobacterium sp.]